MSDAVEVIARKVGEMLGHGDEPEIARVALAALAAAGYRVERVPDDQTRAKAADVLDMFVHGGNRLTIEEAVELLERAFLSPQGDETT